MKGNSSRATAGTETNVLCVGLGTLRQTHLGAAAYSFAECHSCS